MPEINFCWDPLSDNILQERDAAGGLAAEYTTEPGLYGNIISQKQTTAPTEHQFQYDALGSTLVITTNNPMTYATRAYTAFGEITESTGGTISVPFQYIGQKGYYTDSFAGQCTIRRRPYDAVQGRWLAQDPLALVGTSKDVYMYVRNSPAESVDPSGLEPEVQSGFYQDVCLKPTTKGYCGGAEGQVYWRFKEKAKGLKGWVVQHVTWKWSIYNCDNSARQVTSMEFFEAWQVVDGVAYQSYAKMEPMPPWADTFAIGDRGERSKGTVTLTGCAMFLKDFELNRPPWLEPDDENYPMDPHPAPLPVLLPPNMPGGFKDADSLCRVLKSKWDCCTCPISPTDISGSTGWS